MMPTSVLAADNDTSTIAANQTPQYTYINPLYADILTEEDFTPQCSYGLTRRTAVEAFYNVKDAGTALRNATENRQTTVAFQYPIPVKDFTNEGLRRLNQSFCDVAFAHTGVPTQGDYIKSHWSGFSCNAAVADVSDDGKIYYTILTYTIRYNTTQQQEAAVTQRIKSLLTQLNPKGTDYQKIKTVYDWICTNVVYDDANLNNSNYTLKYTAYAALINKTAVCNGYAALLYRFALEMGIDCRFISGFGNGGSHAWNIVKLGNAYYNLDCTWDSGRARYDYFLQSDANFKDHYRDDAYKTSAFYAAYPMGSANYNPNATVKITSQPVNVSAADGKKASTSIKATGEGLTYQWYIKNAGQTKFSKSSLTGTTYTTTMSSKVDGRQVYCVVTDKYGNTAKSNTVTFTLKETIKITSQPKDVTVANGKKASTSVKATGDGLKYQWYIKNAGQAKFSKSSLTGTTYSTTMSSKVDGRQVYCVITDKNGNSVKSATVTFTMMKAVKITSQPKDVTVANGKKASTSIKATGEGLKYQWYIKNAGQTKFSKSSLTGTTYSTTMSSKVDGRQVYCVVTDKNGNSVKSDIITLTLKHPLKITTQPQNVTVADGKKASTSIKATGDGLKYQWYIKNAGQTKFSKSSLTGTTYSVTMSSTVNGRQVYCVVTDQYGNTVQSNTITLKKAK